MPLDTNAKRARLLLAASVTLHIVVLTSTRLVHDRTVGHAAVDLFKRAVPDSASDGSGETVLDLPYSEWYESLPPAARPFFIIFLLFVLAFLFSFIGISASDFFCPNLSTVATYLGLNESTAGVTFLAFGNGSPDVFSTFSAMSGGTVGLAIGELIGAASFIVSIVVGSIALVGPFHVPKNAFLRDVIFFTIAVIVLVIVLHDGRLTLYESGSMVLLYLAYVGVVVGGNWWGRRQRRKAKKERGSVRRESFVKPSVVDGHLSPIPPSPRTEDPLPVPISSYSSSPAPLSPAGGAPSPSLTATSHHRRRSHSSASHLSPIPPHAAHAAHHHHDLDTPTPRAGMSLLGAIEFRDVVNSLRKEGSRSASPSGASTPGGGNERGDYFGPGALGHRRSSSYGIGHHHAHPHPHSHSQRQPSSATLGRRTSSMRGRRRASTHSIGENQNQGQRVVSEPALVPAPPAPLGTEPVGLGISSSEPNPWTDQPGKPPTPSPDSQGITRRADLPRLDIPSSSLSRSELPPPSATSSTGGGGGHPAVPSISVVDPSGHSDHLPIPPTPPAAPPTGSHSTRVKRHLKMALRILFPSLQSFRHKSILGMVLALMSVPAILVLTVTLPVVDDGREGEEGAVKLDVEDGEGLDGGVGREEEGECDECESEEDEAQPWDIDEPRDGGEDDRLLNPHVGEELHHLVDHGFSPLHSPLGRIYSQARHRANWHPEAGPLGVLSPVRSEEGEWEEVSGNEVSEVGEEDGEESCDECDEEELQFNKYLTAVQCVLGPLFCTFITFNGMPHFRWFLLAALLSGSIMATLVLLWATDGTSQPWRLVRCFCGFMCSMVWIAAIADEVVGVLDTVGEILGLSDAIIGLTIFAVGNSLADLVANVTVAQFAPAMAYAACFGGPMLNLLLGVGGSGTYHVLTTPSHAPVHVDFSPTLWVSASGLILMLVTTAIVVPLNGYLIDRRWAACLIVGYAVLMGVNVAVEVKTGRD
ncbi:hypothetical protein IAT38_008191 [Cryptococcus sp. DSM 104549]